MTPEEERELLELEAEAAQAKARAGRHAQTERPGPTATPATREDLPQWASGIVGAANGGTAGYADELDAADTAGKSLALRVLNQPLDLLRPGQLLDDTLDTYRLKREDNRRFTESARRSNPKTFLASEILGGVAMPVPGAGATKGAGLLARMGKSALQGAGLGGAYALGNSNADLTRGQYGDAAVDTVVGAGLGAGVGGAAVPVGAAAKALLRGVVKPTAAAQLLRSKGVEGMTLGQMAPESALAQIEEASTSVGGVGPSIQAQREAARQSWQNAVLNEARPPGMAPQPAGGELSDRLAAAYQGFEPAYAPAKAARVLPATEAGVPLRGIPAPKAAEPPILLDAAGRPMETPIAPKAVPGAFDKVVANRSVMATDVERGVVRNFLEDQLSLLGRKAGKDGTVPAGVLLEMRSNIRAAASDALRASDFPKARLLELAEGEVTSALEAQLPTEAKAALRAADAQYAKHKMVEGAAQRAGDSPNGFTPFQLSQAIKQGTEKGAYARGAGGELRELAAAGRETFDARVPVTGARLLVSGPMQWLTAPAALVANRPSVQRFLLGETAPQVGAQHLVDSIDPLVRALGVGVRNPRGAIGPALLPEPRTPATALSAGGGREDDDTDTRRRKRKSTP